MYDIRFIESSLELDVGAQVLIGLGNKKSSKGTGKINKLEDIQLTPTMLEDEGRVSRYEELLGDVRGSGVMGRHHATYRAAALAGDMAVLPAEALPLVLEWNEDQNTPPLPDSEVEHQVMSAYKYRRDPFASKYLGDFSLSVNTTIGAPSAMVPSANLATPPFRNVDQFVEIPPDVDAVEWMVQNYPLQSGEYRFLDLPQGAGKTEFAKRTVAPMQSAIVLGHRVSLTQNIGKRFDITNYQRDKEAPKVASTIQSLSRIAFDHGRLDLFGYERDCLVVDEYDKVLDTIVAPKQVRQPVNAKTNLFDRIALSKSGLFMSADNPHEYVEFIADAVKARRIQARADFEKLGKEPPPYATVTYFRQRRPDNLYIRRVASNLCLAEFYNDCRYHKAGDQALVMFHTSRKGPHEVRRAVLEDRPDLRVLAISGENSDQEEIQELLADPNRMVTEYDVVICSPACGVGISITQPVKHVYAMHTLRNIVVDDVAQMMRRCRNILSGAVIYGFYNFGEKNDAYDDEALEELSVGYADRTDKMIEAAVRRDMVSGRMRLADDEFLALWKMKKRREIISSNNPQQEILKVFQRHGWTYSAYVEQLDAKEDGPKYGSWLKCRASMEEAKADRWEEHCFNVAWAQEISHDEAKKLDKQYVKTADEKASLERNKIERFYGKEVTKDLVERDDDGKHRDQCREYARAAVRQEDGGEELLATLEHAATNGKHVCQYKHRLMKTLLQLELFKLFFDGKFGDRKNDTVIIQAKQGVKEKIFGFWQQYGGACKRLFRSSLKSVDRSMSFFNSMMKRLGAKVGEHFVSNGEGRMRAYNYDFSQVREDAALEIQRLHNHYRNVLDQHEFATLTKAAAA